MRALRALSFIVTVGVLLGVVLGYTALPETLPLTRAVTAPRSLLVAIRVPAINLLSLLLVELLARALARSPHAEDARRVSAAVFATVGVKAALEGVELFTFPSASSVILPLLMVCVGGGIGVAAWVGRGFVHGAKRAQIAFTSNEKVIAALVFAAIVALQVAPFVARG